MASLSRILSPIRVSVSPSIFPPRNPIFGRFRLLNIKPESFKFVSPIRASKFNSMLCMQGKVIQKLNLSGRRLFTGSVLGLSCIAGMMYQESNVAYAMDDHHVDFGEPSGFLKDDLDNLWSLLKKFQLPFVLLITVLLGWRHPITLAINVVLLLFCTRPSPFSVYIFIEQLRQRDMRQNPGLHKSKLFYVKNVKIEDYKLVCLAKAELRDRKLVIVGILGSWWVLQT